MNPQAGFDQVALPLPLEIERWHGGRRLQCALAPPGMLVVEE
jgi:hypothetical protein